ncbi:MAG: TadE/TadG family type IV pilus assembly protein [Novosphingobium sp.]
MALMTHLKSLGRLLQDESGLAALELALVASTLSMLMLNGVEIARFYFAKMEVQNAAQMAAQNVWKVCDTAAKSPVTRNCSGRTTAMTTGLQSTSLGSSVALSTGYPTEAYYCASTTDGSLISVGPVSNNDGTAATKPSTCSPNGSGSDTPGDYIVIQAQYTYRPIFNAITIGSLLPGTITSTTTMRIQ